MDVCIGKMLFRKKTNLTFFTKDYRRHFELDTETGKVCMETCFLFLLEPVFFVAFQKHLLDLPPTQNASRK